MTDLPRIVVLDGYTLNPGDLSWDALDALGTLTVYERTPYDHIVERAVDAEIVLTNKTVLDASVIARLPRLKYIGVLATGTNVVDVEAADVRDIPVCNVPIYGTKSVAQMVIGQLLAFCHHIDHHSDAVKAGRWSTSEDFCFWDMPQVELNGKTIGIIGFGRIGHQIGRIAAVLGMEVLGYDRTQRAITDVPGFRWVDELHDIFSGCDVISLNCPLTPETAGIINRETLSLMKSNAILLNASRGPLIIEQDLADALNAGHIAGAGLDVLSTEPPSVDNPLLTAKHVIITPHIAWATHEARQRLLNTAIENVSAFLAGQPQHRVK